jgi:capsular polysaccharide biosynthesis protein
MNDAQELVDRFEADLPWWGQMVAAMHFKCAAVPRYGREEAFRLCQTTLRMPDLGLLRERPLRGIRAAALASGWQYTELWRGGARFERPLPRVIGPGNHGPLPGLGRSGWLACIPDAVVRSRSALVLAGDSALLDFEGEEYARVDDVQQFDPSVLDGARDRVWTMESGAPALHLEEAFLLTGHYAMDFGHWITEYLPRYMLATLAGLPEHVPVLIDPHVPATVREALAAMLPAGSRLVEAPHLGEVAVDRLWCAANPNFNSWYPARMDAQFWSSMGTEGERFAPLLREWSRRAGDGIEQDTGIPRLYLARKPDNDKKRLRNQQAIEAIARARGFEVRYPEDFPLGEQIRLARNASHIIAPEGSNALLACFARPGAKALFLSPPYTLPLVDVNGVLAGLGIDLTVLTGPDFPSPHEAEYCGYWNDYEIDPLLFERELDRWLAGDPPDGAVA